ncbi:MAG: hypothetical protein ACYC55_08185 [Candidatus Geothermincolia bacterium]
METVPEEVLQKLAQLYYQAKKKPVQPGLPLWIKNINDMDVIEVEHETRDTIRACKDLKRKLGIMEYEGERYVQGRTRREQVLSDLRREWTLQSYYLYALFQRSGVMVTEEEFDEVIREETGQKTNITNLSSRL